jgi:hypothetical protein
MIDRRVHPCRLLVEGKDERWVLPHLLELAGIPWPDQNRPVLIEEQDGIEKILAPGFIEATLKASGIRVVGVIVDANGDPAARWAKLRGRLLPSYPDLPAELPASGAIHSEPEKPRIGVWLMPDNVSSGMLETLLLELRADQPALRDHVHDATTQARVCGAPFRDTHRHKAELHTWLAWQDPPGRQLHDAVRGRVLAPKSPVTDPFVAWFRQLFEL